MITTKDLSPQAWSDETICVEFSKTSNKKLIGELYRRYYHLVLGMCLKYLHKKEQSRDLASAIFEKLIYKIPETEIRIFKNWLYAVVRTECLMHIRKDKNYNHLKSQIEHTALPQNKHASTEIKNIQVGKYLTSKIKTKEDLVSEALGMLKPEQKDCIVLFFFKNKSYKSIQELTGFSDMQVKSYLQNGKRKIKQYLDKHNKHE